MSKEQLHERIERDGSYHKLYDHTLAQRAMELLRIQFKGAAHLAVDLCPEGRELSMVLTHVLDEGLQGAISAIARDDGQQLDEDRIAVWENVIKSVIDRHGDVSETLVARQAMTNHMVNSDEALS